MHDPLQYNGRSMEVFAPHGRLVLSIAVCYLLLLRIVSSSSLSWLLSSLLSQFDALAGRLFFVVGSLGIEDILLNDARLLDSSTVFIAVVIPKMNGLLDGSRLNITSNLITVVFFIVVNQVNDLHLTTLLFVSMTLSITLSCLKVFRRFQDQGLHFIRKALGCRDVCQCLPLLSLRS
jgi:hypothetical protein